MQVFRRRAFAAALLLGVAQPAAWAADLDIAATTTTGVDLNLYAGTTVDILSGVSVSNTLGGPTISGTGTWTLGNHGSVSGQIKLDGAGSLVSNSGLLTGGNAITLVNGGTVINELGATINASSSAISIGKFPSGGNPGVGPGVVSNSGTITQVVSGGDLVLLQFGGSVTNTATGVITGDSSGNAVSIGQGTERTVINSGSIINTRVTGFSTGVFVQGGPSTITNNAGAVIKGGYNGVYASATGVLTFTNAGTIESTGSNASSKAVEATGGGTFLNSGTIRSAAGDGLYLNAAGTVTNSGTITGAVNAINFNGSSTRTLMLDTGSVLNGLVKGGTGTDNLILLGAGSESVARFLNFETLSMQGSAWALNDAGGFSTSAEVQAGVLTIAGTLTSPAIDIRALGTVRGTGTLAGAVNNAGTIDLTAGTLHVSGAYANGGTGVLQVGVTPVAATGALAVSGVATLSGGTVRALTAPGVYTVGSGYKVLTAASVLGGFGGVVDDSAFLQFVLDYDTPGVVWLRVSAIANLPAIAETPNQFATATALQALPSSPLFDAVVPLNTAAALEAFDDLSGEVHASLLRVLADASRNPREAAFDRVDAAFAALAEGQVGARDIWARGYGGAGTVNGDGNAAGFDFGSGGLLVGVDGLVSRELFLGVLAGNGGVAVDLPARDSRAEATSYQIGLYGGAALGEVRLAFGAALASSQVSVTRTPSFSGFSETVVADYTTTTAQLFGELGYVFELNEVTLTPFARAALLGQSGGRYAESGGDAVLSGASDAIGAAVLTAGLKVARRFVLGDGLVVAARGSIALEHTTGDQPTATHSFAGGTPFTLSGAKLGDTALLLGAGLGTEMAPGVNLDLGYQGQFGSAQSAQAVKLTLSGKL
ncbi:MAG TPA: autotransporter domain-containing protein [Devosia sp.]|uniref:autotransporter outer membrane beta-barrel domain-containing protein n=1 Tax=Devosia sp. TaxID=1871048 RepID=UPI002DDD3EDB|nr:autotransporter domain-containing protein [Devosia sp.]HEV2515983.1 autotransporter domain-containing protein [Devosia sp.]